MQRALELDPHNPAHYETLARWYERYAMRLPGSSAVRTVYLEQSAAHLRRTLFARPGSAYAWAGLAAIKVRLAQFDAELDAAVVRAWLFGPREPDVQIALARISSQADDRLGPGAREAARGAMTIVCTAATPLVRCPSPDVGKRDKR
jgi:cytochrome c-type biogenesis protein CcmH/NrfG